MRSISIALAGVLLGCAANPVITSDGGPPPTDSGSMMDSGGDPCAACDPLATCDAAMATCTCPMGYDDPMGDGSSCVMSSPCTDGTHDCDRNASCAASMEPPFYACTCDPGYQGDGATCNDADECADDTDDCSVNATCMNTDGAYECECTPPFVGDGRSCRTPRTVLIYYDGAETLADDAVSSMGFTVDLTSDGDAFNTAYDARGFDLILWESSASGIPAGAESRLSNWAAGGRPLIFSFWDLSSSPALQTSLQVTASVSFATFRPIHVDPATTVDLFTLGEMIPTPLTGLDRSGDNGDELSASSGGFLAARFDSSTGPGAIAVTRAGKVLTHGFLPHDVLMTDGDMDGTPDMQELYVNEIRYLFP